MDQNLTALTKAVSDEFRDADNDSSLGCLAAQRYITSDGKYRWEVTLTEGINDSLTHFSDIPEDFKTEADAVSMIDFNWDSEWDEED